MTAIGCRTCGRQVDGKGKGNLVKGKDNRVYECTKTLALDSSLVNHYRYWDVLHIKFV
jgi:hypothetical protein